MEEFKKALLHTYAETNRNLDEATKAGNVDLCNYYLGMIIGLMDAASAAGHKFIEVGPNAYAIVRYI